MIDVHLHVHRPGVPGLKPLGPVGELYDGPPMALADALKREMAESGLSAVLAMGSLDAPPDDPLGVNAILRLSSLVPGLQAIGAADPRRTQIDHLKRVETAIETGKVRGLKAYLGYIPVGPDDPGYRPYIRLAAKYKLPFVFHTGDTWSTRAKVRFAHPLRVDDVAVDHPDVSFVLAHFGNPWLMDAAEVVYKNENVWADLSALLVGDAATLDKLREQYLKDGIIPGLDLSRLEAAYAYVDKPHRFLFGSDWPLVSIRAYRDILKALVPEDHHAAVFERNALSLFGLDPK